MPRKSHDDKMRWQRENRRAHPERERRHCANSRKAQMGDPGSERRTAFNKKENARRKRRRSEIILAEVATARRLEEEEARKQRERGYEGTFNLEAIR